ncbi:MAG: NADH-quinone oxidoreductase subunit J [Candidatus Marinimicrobia bacterium]|nr:NADH-quinone oxidoreductase subunit J [Candidatus Neomarinimicrobiota bacterium]MBL7060027.1 NADH-quinone oxidoreductase subunit J [Candidatus Neomarinimicrobiota bacterium]
MADVIFWVIAGITVLSAFIVVLNKNLIHSAVALLFTFFGVAGLYAFLWADFMAGAQVMIYIGGILVLIMFGIMLTNKIQSVNISHSSMQKNAGAVVVVAILGLLIWMIQKTPWKITTAEEPIQTTGQIGNLLMSEYLLPFEVASILLLAALIGAAMLSRKTK